MFKALRLAANCVCVWALLLLPSAASTKTAFPVGKEYTFYRGSTSSQAETVSCKPAFAAVYKYIFSASLTGESTVYGKDEYTPEEIMENFSAELLFTETVCGVTNYYCYTGELGAGVTIGDYEVNLHVAQSAEQTAVGTPLIFGGF